MGDLDRGKLVEGVKFMADCYPYKLFLELEEFVETSGCCQEFHLL